MTKEYTVIDENTGKEIGRANGEVNYDTNPPELSLQLNINPSATQRFTIRSSDYSEQFEECKVTSITNGNYVTFVLKA